jgi:hypothetical protein
VSSVRFTKDFQFFDYDGSRLYRRWRTGDLISAPKEIEWLFARGAPVEPIEMNPETPITQSNKF